MSEQPQDPAAPDAAPAAPTGPKATIQISAAKGEIVVDTISGQQLELLTWEEKAFYEEARDKYLSENVFSAASDMRALDRLLFFETQMHRWQWQLSLGMNYEYEFLDTAQESQLRRNVKETAPLISQLQNDLGLTKTARDKDKHDSVTSYIQQLQIAAKEHGIRREKQLGKAIELTKELFNVAGSYKRSNAAERKKLGFESAEDVVDWVLECMKPEFDEVDAYFREHQQKMWLRKI